MIDHLDHLIYPDANNPMLRFAYNPDNSDKVSSLAFGGVLERLLAAMR